MDDWTRVLIGAGITGLILAVVGGLAVPSLVVPGVALVACAQVGWVVVLLVRPPDDPDAPSGGWR